ncbi:MAG: hypothetical protein LIO79_09590 [Rikenellaceae bacterium]|nr:hypothetical protein [Rikenellaceae bacterium]
MDNKLQRLTQKLYEEGLSKGRTEAEELVANAKKEAEAIIKKAKEDAETLKRNAEKESVDLKRNTKTEISLASKQMIGIIKQQIERLVIADKISPAVKDAVGDKSFVKEVIIALAKNWNENEGNKLDIVLPADTDAAFEKELSKEVGATLGQGFEITLDKGVKSGFRVAPKDGGYYISFSDADFDALFKEFVRPKVAELIFGGEK